MKRILKVSVITLPVSVLFVLFMDLLMRSIFGGLVGTQGFPIPYYRDLLTTPEIEYSIPQIKYLDIGLVYIVLTYIGVKLFKE